MWRLYERTICGRFCSVCFLVPARLKLKLFLLSHFLLLPIPGLEWSGLKWRNAPTHMAHCCHHHYPDCGAFSRLFLFCDEVRCLAGGEIMDCDSLASASSLE